MLWIHPLMQFVATLLGLWVMEMGVRRFLFVHMKRRKVLFPWKRHVQIGKAVLVVWLAGLLIGVLALKQEFGAWGVTGGHFNMAVVIAALAGIGYVTGHILDKYKKRRKVLHIFHGLNNTVLLALALYQVFSGWNLMRTFQLL